MENVKPWQYVVLCGGGAIAGILAAVAFMREGEKALVDLMEKEAEDEALRAFQAGWKACSETTGDQFMQETTKEIARKLLEAA